MAEVFFNFINNDDVEKLSKVLFVTVLYFSNTAVSDANVNFGNFV